MGKLFAKLDTYVAQLDATTISEERKQVLQPLIDYIQGKVDQHLPVNLILICTHNSRRSQFSQIWAQVAAHYHDVPNVHCYSGGVEVTAFNERAVKAIEKTGISVSSSGDQANPVYSLLYSDDAPSITAFSKTYDDPANPHEAFAAVMTCSHADKNCPFIPGTDARIPLNYEDPKAFDDTPQETEKYDERCKQIATELFYVFGEIK